MPRLNLFLDHKHQAALRAFGKSVGIKGDPTLIRMAVVRMLRSEGYMNEDGTLAGKHQPKNKPSAHARGT